MTTYVTTPVHTGNVLSVERKIDIPEKIFWLYKDEAPLLMLSAGKAGNGLPAKKKACINPEFKVLEKEPHGEWSAINYSTGYTAGATTLTLDTVANINIGYTIVDVSTNEHMRVTNKAGSTVTVARAQGATAATTISDNDPILILGNTSEEKSAVPNILLVQNRERTNYCEIVRFPIGLSGTAENSEFYGGKKRTELHTEAVREWNKMVERKFLWQEPYSSATGGPQGYPIRQTGGAYYWIVSGGGQVTTATTTFTKSMWLAFVATCFVVGSDSKMLLCGPKIIEMLEYWKDAKLEFRPTDEVYGLRVAEWETAYGRLFIKPHRMFKNSPYGTTTLGYSGMGMCIDPESVSYRYLQNRDAKLRENIVSDGSDGYTDDILGEVGFGIVNPETCAILKDVSTYA